MPATKEELEKKEQQLEEEIAKVKERILIVLRENHPNFLSQAEISDKLDKNWFNPLWETRFLRIFLFSLHIQRILTVRNTLHSLVQEGKIIEKLGMYGLK